ncbi:MAG: ATP-binding protein [Pleomorphochaeta sp.]
MKFKRQLSLLLLFTIILILFSSLFSSRRVFSSIITEQEQNELKNKALFINSFDEIDYQTLQNYALYNKIRITLIDNEGNVFFDSEKDFLLMDNHLYREEIKSSLINEVGYSIRTSKTTSDETLYCALYSSEKNIYIRVAAPISKFSFLNSQFIESIIPILLVIIIIVSIALLIILRLLFIPIESLVEVSKGYAKGELDARTHITSPLEIKELSQTLNYMAEEIQQIISNLEREKNEYSLVLESMQEGVIFLNTKKEIVLCNKAAVTILGKAIKKGMVVRDILSDIDLITQINNAITNFEKSELEIWAYKKYTGEMAHIYGKGNEKNLHITISSMEKNNICEGALLTISDNTEINRLERIRKDFVSNVSHELKTPLTSIGGFTEILINNELSKEQANEFYDDIYTNYQNMKAIIEDLLLLSSLEKNKAKPNMEEVAVSTIIESSIKTVTPLANKKNITIKKDYLKNLTVFCSESLIKQALINLVINAINYSPENSKIKISVTEKKYEIIFKVTDYGIGIPSEDIDRIFERFYRVDKNRSRDSGGTGLGLSIVKHIAILHSGNISVKSEENKGSTFKFSISKTNHVLTSLFKKSDLMYKV